jgi:ATP synthase F1 delta subunit
MNTKIEILARKYAHAFLNCFGSQINRETFNTLCTLETFFRSNKKILYFLSLSSLTPEVKKRYLHELFNQFNVAHLCDPLLHTLLLTKRGQLIGAVLTAFVELYKTDQNIASFTITSSHPLEPLWIASLEQFLADVSGCDIIYNYNVDNNLIAGIRMQSDTLLWEYSIKKQLGIMRHS